MKKVAIIGGGIVGATIAIELANRYESIEISIFEKENNIGSQASTNNSGVVHAGFYYEPSSIKAKITGRGNKRMRDFIIKHDIPHDKCGKIVVATNQPEKEQLKKLKYRADTNGVETELIEYSQAKEINSEVADRGEYLWSPNTWSANPFDVMNKLSEQIKDHERIDVKFNHHVRGIKNSRIQFKDGRNSEVFDYFINAAGINALDIAKNTKDVIRDDNVIVSPFVGKYLKLEQENIGCKTHIYPVPDPNLPFLGIHITKTADGKIKLGPTATPLIFTNKINSGDINIANEGINLIKMLVTCKGNLMAHSINELQYLAKSKMIQAAQKLTSVDLRQCKWEWAKSGVRPQLYSLKKRELLMDFEIRKGVNSLHILNSISPAWTSSFALAEYYVDMVKL